MMKPSSFEYHAPNTVDEALALLKANGPDSRVLAGGQSLIPIMNFRLAAPPVIIDLKTAGIGGAAAHHTLHRAATNLISGRVILIHSHVRAGYNGGIASAESRR